MSSTKITRADVAKRQKPAKRQTLKDSPEYYIKNGRTALMPDDAFIVQELAAFLNVRAFSF